MPLSAGGGVGVREIIGQNSHMEGQGSFKAPCHQQSVQPKLTKGDMVDVRKEP
jgi:hypothetical protein